MRLLYVVRHASPLVEPGVPSERWELSARGVEEARALGRVAAGWGLRALYASGEPKARQTAALMGEAVGLPAHLVEGFEELRLGRWFGNADEFSAHVRDVLEQADVSCGGSERASAAAARFAAGIRIVEQGPFPAAVVAHGRVLTAYLAELLAQEDPFALWRSIPLPGWASVDLDATRRGFVEPFAGLP